jgi:hypothetical protein
MALGSIDPGWLDITPDCPQIQHLATLDTVSTCCRWLASTTMACITGPMLHRPRQPIPHSAR